MQAQIAKAFLSACLAVLLAGPVQADEAPHPASGVPVAVGSGQPTGDGSATIPPQATARPMAFPAGAVGMWVPVPVQTRPGMPAVLTWVPVIFVPMAVPAPVPVPAPQAAVVDYGPVSEAPVVDLPAPEEPGAAPEPAAAGEAGAVAGIAAAVTVDDGPAWAPPDVDYGPVTPTPVVDLLELEKALSAPPPKPAKPSRPSGSNASKPKAQAASKPAAPTKKRMCWENGIVAPCK